jgi:C-terminal processing protease CtpA/Prc
MEANSLHRLTIDWAAFRASVLAEAGGAQAIAETYPAIRTALRLLGDGHTTYRPAAGPLIWVPNRTCSAAAVTTPALPATIGYVRVSWFVGDAAQATAFANGIQDQIRAKDRADLTGWIVDLRGNGGGNMWPMLAGIGPILGEGVAGHFVAPSGAATEWGYSGGASYHGATVVQRVDVPYRLQRERPRVAVLTDNLVGSSGEAMVVAFRKRPDTRSFGTATCGLSTANRQFTLADGAVLNLTVSVMADRALVKYGDSITPDETLTVPDAAVQRAVAWLQSGS